ncbi:NGFI-A-binding protein homolog isoform X3 [Amphibalanus amphitrite]|uniref:NGFI-A-binding protein homolog isoform X3 n=1 Tax=Amphibalanus amphitrite TaxID=1232801 RepID=UPI001C8FF51B|nr:NGFI-A-binding protein homolog isoform X3 [Amphibalanus amphitrite]
MEHVNGVGAVPPRYLLNGAGAAGAPAAQRLGAALTVCSTPGLPGSAAALAGAVSSAGLTVTPSGAVGPPTSGRQSVPALSRSPLLAGPPLPATGVVFSRNRYGQVTMTSQPTNESELQLYRVLQHANLLSYYDVFISQGKRRGGDDVQQLCEAGEEEFLEIMALVGMASKPLHVRRLQKALQEWVSSPGKFHVPLLPVPTAGFLPAGRALVGQLGGLPPAPAVSAAPLPVTVTAAPVTASPVQPPVRAPSAPAAPAARSTPPAAASPTPSLGRDRDSLPSPSHSQSSREPWPSRSGPGEESSGGGGGEQYPTSSSPLQLTPTLRASQIRRLADTALAIAKTLPDFEPRQQHSSKRKACKELEYVVGMDPDDPKRMDKIREYAAIYGRFDCKRKAEKPLTLHEVSVNEAAAQICLHVPALLTRRDELFPLARQVVRNSGYQYSKGHSRSQGAQCYSPRDLRLMDEGSGGKRMRLDSDSPPDPNGDPSWRGRQDRLEQIADELRQLQERGDQLRQLQERGDEGAPADGERPAGEGEGEGEGGSLQQQIAGLERQQQQLRSEQTELVQESKQSFKNCLEIYDDDSQYSLSSAASPQGPAGDSSREGDPIRAEGTREADAARLDTSDRRLTKKLVQETLVDEGLRVVRGLVSHGPPTSGGAHTFFPEHKVIASAAGTIIAVANPALSMSQLSQPGPLAARVKTEPGPRVKVEPAGSPPAANGRRPAD